MISAACNRPASAGLNPLIDSGIRLTFWLLPLTQRADRLDLWPGSSQRYLKSASLIKSERSGLDLDTQFLEHMLLAMGLEAFYIRAS
jgi:hypothetical protein